MSPSQSDAVADGQLGDRESEVDRVYAIGVVLGPDECHHLKVIRQSDGVQIYSTAASWGIAEGMARAAAAMLADVRGENDGH